MTAYATDEQLAAYLGTAAPDESARLLDRATEAVQDATFGRIDLPTGDEGETLTDDQETCAKATCAQVEYWLSVGEDVDTGGVVTDVKAGSLSIKQTPGASTDGGLSPRAERILRAAGLLYCGARLR